MARLPLDGIRIIDSGHVFAVPYACGLMADLGAEVIKIEGPGRLDITRDGPFSGVHADNQPGTDPWNRTANFNLINRGKKSLVLDLSQAEGREVLKDLIRVSDVFMESFTPRVMRGWGLEYPDMKAIKPDIIMVSNTGYGRGPGPYSQYPAQATTQEATHGLAHVTGYRGGLPSKAGQSYVDFLACWACLMGIALALRYRQRSGKGLWLDVGMYQLGCYTTSEYILDWLANNRVGERLGNRHPSYAPQGCYPCAGNDQWCVVSVRDDEEWAALCRLMGTPELTREARFATNRDRITHHDEIDAIIAQWTRTLAKFEVMERLQGAGVPAGAVFDAKDVNLDRHYWSRGFLETVRFPAERGMGTRVIMGRPWRLSKTPLTVKGPGPALGQHNRDVLQGILGYSEGQYADLEQAGVIGTRPTKPRPLAHMEMDERVRHGRLAYHDPGFKEHLRIGGRRPAAAQEMERTMGTTERLAQWIVATSYDDVPAAAYEQAKKSILDYLGTTIQGSTTELGRMVIDFTQDQGGNPQARVIATNIRTASASAAFANGALGHAEDFDDLGGIGGHPATVLTPTALALAEELHRSGRELLAAWAIGYEVGTRLSANLHPDRDWHPTAIFGTMAAAAVASKLLNLDVQKTRMALGIAGSQAAGLRRNFGTMTKPFHPGHAARSGVVAAKLAAKGFTADPDIIEGRQGYADNFGGAKCNLPAVTQFLGHVYYLATEGTRIKPWPCCGGNHQTLTGVMGLLQKHTINPDEVALIEHIGPNVPCTGALLRDEVHQGLEGKFCLRYNIAAAIIDGKVDLETFTDKRADQGDIQALMTRVSLIRNPDVTLRRPHIADGNPEARLRIQMRDGRVHDVVLGPAMHLTGDAVVDKFRANAGFVFEPEQVRRPIELVQRLDTMADVTELMNAVTTGSQI